MPTIRLAPPPIKQLLPILDSGAEISCFPTTANNHPNPTGTRIILPNGTQAASVGTTACRVGPISFDANMFQSSDITLPLLAAHDLTATGATIEWITSLAVSQGRAFSRDHASSAISSCDSIRAKTGEASRYRSGSSIVRML